MKSQYEAGNFLMSGRKKPRTGGIIISNVNTREHLDQILQQDPYYQNKVADYSVVEFEPGMTCAELEFLI